MRRHVPKDQLETFYTASNTDVFDTDAFVLNLYLYSLNSTLHMLLCHLWTQQLRDGRLGLTITGTGS